MDSRPWFDRWPELLAEYYEQIAAAGWVVESHDFDVQAETVTATVSGVPAPLHTVEVVLGPSTSARPRVLTDVPLPLHRHPTEKHICLPDDVAGPVEAIEATIHLYELDAVGGIEALRSAGVAAAEPRTEYIDTFASHACLTAGDLPGGSWGTFRLRGRTTDSSFWGWVRSMRTEPPAHGVAGPVWTSRADAVVDANLYEAGGTLNELDGVWIRVGARDFPTSSKALLRLWHHHAPQEAEVTRETLHAIGPAAGSAASAVSPRSTRLLGLVLPEEGPEHDQWSERLVILVEQPSTIRSVVTKQIGTDFARVPGHEALRDKTVAIAGLGMIGAPLPTLLARTGVGSLRLLDHDSVEPGNLVRQDFTAVDIGRSKVDAVRDMVSRRAPWCDIPRKHTLRARVGLLTYAEAARWLDGADLLVLATADRRADLFLSAVASDLGVPVVGGAATYGIWGAIAWRTAWGVTGCRGCLDIEPALMDVPADPDERSGLFVPGCGQPTFPGTAVDGGVVTSLVARFAVAALAGNEQGTPTPLAALRLRDEHGIIEHSVEWRELDPHLDCPSCERHVP